MTALIYEVFDALRTAGVSEEKARSAAQALYERDSQKVGDLLADIKSIKADVVALKTRSAIHAWMLGGIFTLLIPIFIKTVLGL